MQDVPEKAPDARCPFLGREVPDLIHCQPAVCAPEEWGYVLALTSAAFLFFFEGFMQKHFHERLIPQTFLG